MHWSPMFPGTQRIANEGDVDKRQQDKDVLAEFELQSSLISTVHNSPLLWFHPANSALSVILFVGTLWQSKLRVPGFCSDRR